jgi:DNA-binding MarR family transcriptional regulator/GNAT superfamily N-acetyltransferase
MTDAAPDPGLEQRLEIMRAFGRMYMQRIGILDEQIFGSPYSPAEVRVINEIAFRKCTTATALARELRIDGGYLSRILSRLERDDLITKERSKEDARQRTIVLTKKGCKVGGDILEEARKIMMGIVGPLSVDDQRRLIEAMNTIDRLINDKQERRVPALRPPKPGDMGRIIHAHAARFAEEFGWNSEFEAFIAERAAEFIRNFDPEKECCFVAEMGPNFAGSAFLVRHTDEIAEIRLLYVAPEARRLGVGKEMLGECLRFARQAGYKKVRQEMESSLLHAASLLSAAGMKVVQETPQHRFGKDMVHQVWEMDL